MGPRIRQYAIAITNLFAGAGFTVITPFYPEVAKRSGVPTSLIGLILSTFPIMSILTSFLLPKIMFSIGRNTTLLLGLFIIASNNFIISLIEDFPPTVAILVSFMCRSLSGIGAAFEAVASTSILSSDYPGEFAKLVAVIEVFGGLGIIIGPLAGSLLFTLGGFKTSCFGIGIFVLCYIPVLLLVIGKEREYVIDEKENISMMTLMKKPKVFLNFFMALTIMFGIGITMPTLEPHLINYGLKEEYVGYWYIINTGAYFLSSILMIRAGNLPKQKMMLAGVFGFTVSFFLLGPCPYVFDKSIVAVGVGHHIMGWAAPFQYIPLLPYLIDILHDEYKFPIDDRLNDSIAGIVNIAIGCGEILGPIFGSLLPEMLTESLKYRMTFLIVSIVFLGYGIIYIFIDRWLSRKPLVLNDKAFEEEMIPLENAV